MKKFFDDSHSVTIAPSTIIFSVFFILGLYFLYVVREIALTFLMALIVMSALHPSLRWMQRKLHLPKALGIVILYFFVILLIVLAFAIIVPPLFAQVPNLIHSLDLPPLPDDIRNFNFTVNELNDILMQLQSSFGTIITIISSTFRGVFTFFTILVLSAYLLMDRDNLHKRIGWFSRDPHHMQIAKDFVDSMELQLGGWVRGQFFLMVIIGVATYVGLTILQVPYALPLALAAGLLEMLPNLGPTISAVPAIVVAYTTGGPTVAVAVTIFYIIVQQLENHFIVPNVMRKNVDVSPLITILVILTGFKLLGVIGALLAVPIYILVRSVYSIWLKENAEVPEVKVAE